MKGYIKFLRFTLPYKSLTVLNILCNLLSTIFGLFSISMLMPLLTILFDQNAFSSTITQAPNSNASNVFEYLKQFLTNYKNIHGASSTLLLICIAIVVMIVLKNIFRYLALYFMIPMRNYIMSDLRVRAYNRILILPLSYFSEEKKGDILSRLTSDMHQVEVAIMNSLEAFTKEPIAILVFVSSLIWISPMLTLIVFLTLPISALFLSLIGKILKKQSIRSQVKFGELVSMIEETLMGIRVIKAFNAQDFFLRNFKTENAVYTKLNIAANRTSDGSSPISETISVSVFALILLIGGNMVLSNDNSLSPEVFITYLGVFSQIISPAKMFSTAFNYMNKGLASLERIDEIITSEEIIIEKPAAVSLTKFSKNIEFKNVSFKYADEYVLQNINLNIEKGKTIALVGPSGGGKSTLTDLVPRFYDPTEGSILIDGIDIREYKILDLRAIMGIVTQESILFNESIYNNIAFGKTGVSNEQIENAAKTANAHEFIIETENNYQTNIGDRGNKLSGGQKQRLSIARAVNINPDILILDEATSSLDTQSERLVQEALANVMKNRTTIVVAHRLSTVKNADIIVVLEKGKIVQQGTHNELINTDGLYRKLTDMQQLVD